MTRRFISFILAPGSMALTTALLLAAAQPAHAAPRGYVLDQCTFNSTTGSQECYYSVFDSATDATVGGPVAIQGSEPTGLALNQDGKRAYISEGAVNGLGDSGGVQIINPSTNSTITSASLKPASPSLGGGVVVSPDGSRAYVADTYNDKLDVLDTATNTVTTAIPMPVTYARLGGPGTGSEAVSPDGKRVYVLESAGGCGSSCPPAVVAVIDTMTNTVVATVPLPYPVAGTVAVSPNGLRLYATSNSPCTSSPCYVTGTLSIIDTATNTVTANVPLGTGAGSVAASPDGKHVYVNGNSIIYKINVTSDTVTPAIPVTSGNVTTVSMAISPDGNRLYRRNGNAIAAIDTTTDSVLSTLTFSSVSLLLRRNTLSVGPGALIAANSSAATSATRQLSASVPALVNNTPCAYTEAVVQNPLHGSVNFDSTTGAYTYTPGSATYSGPDAFTWRGQAASGCTTANAPANPVSNTASVSLTVNPLITGLGDATVGENGMAQQSFTLVGSPPFTHTLASDNATVLSPANMVVLPTNCGTTGYLNCKLWVLDAPAPGTASVTVTAKDKYGDPVKKTVRVTVVASPSLTGLAPVTITAPASAGAGFAITGTGPLTVTATSSNTTLLPDSGVTGQSTCSAAGNCTLTLKPTIGQTGTAKVTVTVNDSYGQSTTGNFALTVNKPATPTASGFSNLNLTAGSSGSESLTLAGTGSLSLTATSSNTTVLPDSDISGVSACTAAGPCTLTVNAPGGQSGTATVDVTVKDGYGQIATGTFDVTVSANTSTTPGGGGSGGGGGALGPLALFALAGLLALALRRRGGLRGPTPGK